MVSPVEPWHVRAADWLYVHADQVTVGINIILGCSLAVVLWVLLS